MRQRISTALHDNSRRFAPFLVGGILLIASIIYLLAISGERNGPLQGSGTVEATQIQIASEIGGRIVEVLVEEGQQVEAGQVLVRFDDVLLQAQLAQAEANLALVSAGPSPEERQAAVAAAQLEMVAAQQALDEVVDNTDLTNALALQAIANTQDTVRDAQRYVDNLEYGAIQTDIDRAFANMILLRDQLEDVQEDYEDVADKPEDNLARAAQLSRLADIQDRYDDAVTLYNNFIAEANEIDLAIGNADILVAEALLALSEEDYEVLSGGPDPDQFALAQARLNSAQAHLAVAQAEPRQEQVDMAQAQVDLVRAQLAQLTLTAPMDGTIVVRNIDPGELAGPGTPVLTLANLADLTITVYIPEDRYGVLSLDQQAQVAVDSFPGEEFEATVVRIADQAEFTPRNVQTPEGRKTTVFAIKLSVQNEDQKLKPGMPADVTFGP
ncbi:MAG: HlyD family efflux transporter periplasmic adaptor subunit [Chloroflexi bacterium]|nr:MAG: HlyD family efflux transporter periplasmic adaptor subunit [Chloroflexota bacterium]MBL1197411.1 HlyD family efflux transporter periplasmic adaptor subunit [Chloroflexota bacterium]NOH14707.1 HlyD family efflux transporter periplasmic adaptor subunit [Chloroflexota bacterium]